MACCWQLGQTTEAAKTTRLSQFLQEVFRADTDLHTLRVAALTLGRLVKAGGPVTAEVVDSEVWVRVRVKIRVTVRG